MPNLQIVKTICGMLDELKPCPGAQYERLLVFVKDRRGHDRRYSIDARKIEREIEWPPAETFESGIRKTVLWYLEHLEWVVNVQSGAYREWVARQYDNPTSGFSTKAEARLLLDGKPSDLRETGRIETRPR